MKLPKHVQGIVLFITCFIVRNLEDVQEGIGHRYAGLYGSFITKYSYIYSMSWYSLDERILVRFEGADKTVKKKTLPFKVLKKLADESSSKGIPFYVITDYPYFFGRVGRGVRYLLPRVVFGVACLFFIKQLQVRKRCIHIVDAFDFPLEGGIAFKYFSLGKPLQSLFLIVSQILELLILRTSFLIFTTNSYAQYLKRKWSISSNKINVIPSGSFPDRVKPQRFCSSMKKQMVVVYSGALRKDTHIRSILTAIRRLREQGCDIRFEYTGASSIEVSRYNWVSCRHQDSWVGHQNLLGSETDVGVIPYPPTGHWRFDRPAKLYDYMNAQKPVISTPMPEVARILKEKMCGFVARSTEEFEEYLLRLYLDDRLRLLLGRNGRKAIEEDYDYMKHADKLCHLLHAICKR